MQLNKKIILIIVAFLLCIGFICIRLIEPKESERKETKEMERRDADIDNIQVNIAEIIYYDDNVLIFKDYYGLFIYSLNDKQLINSLDMKYIACDKNEGDNACVFDTYNSGKIIKLFNQADTYYFDWENNKLYVSYDESEVNKDNESNIHGFLYEKTNMSPYSYNYVKNGEEIIYLNCTNGAAEDVALVVEKNGEIVRTENIFSKK